ncbi:MAG TPA: TonB-dependent receptor [Candidatus Solibacter sp.]|nr:TonB-dependent receptor [Candidatus Solibacter sp.]
MRQAAILAILAWQASGRVLITGTVRDALGAGIPDATVYLRGSAVSVQSASDGHFELTGDERGEATVVAVRSGFQAAERAINLSDQPVTVDLQLAIESIASSIDVPAQASTETAASARLAPLDVYRTPGTDGDIMRALQMMPGVARVDEGSGLFVRGGDVSETATYLDRALLFHPYRYETPTGGFFGSVPPYLISGLSLSTGAFPARYGNALSGILELTGLDRPQQDSLTVTLGLGSISGSAAIPLGESMGVRVSGNQSLARALFAVNPGEQRFAHYPSGQDLNVSSYAGPLRVSAFLNREQVGVEAQQDAFTGLLNSKDDNRLISAGWHRNRCEWRMEVSASAAAYRAEQQFGVFELSTRDDGQRARFDVSRPHSRWIVRLGMEAERRENSEGGAIPVHGGDVGGAQGTRLWSMDRTDARGGVYAEIERTFGRLTLNAGGRVDRYQAIRAWSADPRASAVYALPRRQRLRAAWGAYHQVPAPLYLHPIYGNPALRPMTARHFVAGYEAGEDAGRFYLRVEGYLKRYSRLPLQDDLANFNSSGYGTARGVDVFLKLKPSSAWQSWASYSYLRARRLFTAFDDYGRYDTPTAPYRPDFDIPHTLQLVLQRAITPSLSAGVTARVASGKPFTPVIAAQPSRGGFVPVFGAIGSERLPLYQRVDCSLSKMLPVARRISAVLFFGVNNVLDHHNVFAWSYSSDYTQRRPAQGAWGRAFYFGVSMQR